MPRNLIINCINCSFFAQPALTQWQHKKFLRITFFFLSFVSHVFFSSRKCTWRDEAAQRFRQSGIRYLSCSLSLPSPSWWCFLTAAPWKSYFFAVCVWVKLAGALVLRGPFGDSLERINPVSAPFYSRMPNLVWAQRVHLHISQPLSLWSWVIVWGCI